MFAKWKASREKTKAVQKAVEESRYWREHPLLRECLQSMRGSCTVAPVEMHEAAIAVVNIALREGEWLGAAAVTADFMEDMVFLVWDDEKLPVLKAPWGQVRENLDTVTAVAKQAFLVAQTLDRIIWFDAQNSIKLYSIV